jgi:hypothetical protein
VGDIPFRPDSLSVGPELFRLLKQSTPQEPGPLADPALFGLPVTVDRWMPDGFVVVVGPPKDPASLDPLDRIPQVRIIRVGR